jgi:hypothetical protein
MNYKKCFKCGAEKPLTEFYKHPRMADGHVNKCKKCNKADVRENRETKVEYYKEYDVKRYAEDPSVRLRISKVSKLWREKYPERYKAHTAVSNAVRAGKLTKNPCVVCGTLNNLHAHHEDYSKPLEVLWLCAEHHRAHHDNFANLQLSKSNPMATL